MMISFPSRSEDLSRINPLNLELCQNTLTDQFTSQMLRATSFDELLGNRLLNS